MTPNALLDHLDRGLPWPHAPGEVGGTDLDAAYAQALAVRGLRIARGERPVGYKVGFTNRTIWARYNVFAPIWGTVWDSSVSTCDEHGVLSLDHTCQPRLEPEIVFGMKSSPRAGAGLDELFDAIEWLAPGFEVVQSHLPDWKFTAADTVADSGLHARLLVGARMPASRLAASSAGLDRLLAEAQLELFKADKVMERGTGANVLGSPLRALMHFLAELRRCEGAVDLRPGDMVTTGTWTDAWSVQPGETWHARFTHGLGTLSVTLA